MAAQSPLTALLALLTSSIQVLESSYAKEGLAFPSLDDPFAPTAIDRTPEVLDASRLAIAAAAQIIATVRDPLETIGEAAAGSYAAAALNVTVDVHVANILKDAGDDGMHISDIATRAGVPPDSLGRLLRYLATRHIFREVKPDTFSNNRISSTLVKRHSIEEIKADKNIEYEGSPAAALVGHTTDEGMKGAVAISSWVQSGHKDYPSPFNIGNNVDVDVFRWYETEEHRGRRFHVAMTGAGARFSSDIFTEGFDWGSLQHDSVVVDVGGSVGSVTLTLLKAYPHLRYVVQDLGKVIAYDAPKYWNTQLPSAVSTGRVTLQSADFFSSQPVKGAAVYFMRAIIHDWPDDRAKQIMKVIRDAAAPSSRLVVFDMIMPYACPYDGPFSEVVAPVKAPYPLLANFGMGKGGFVTMVDIQMLNFFNGKERTVGEFIEIGRLAGWKLERVRPGMMAALVFSPV